LILHLPLLVDHHLDQPPWERHVLLQDKQLKLWADREKEIYKKLKEWDFILTPAFDPALL
jgi:hypothetical protein